jgi:hypothetical protein
VCLGAGRLVRYRAFRYLEVVTIVRDDGSELAIHAMKMRYDVDETLRRRGGRPPIGAAPASVESVRLDPELRQALTQRAERDHETPSSVIRKALRKYLQVG